MNQKFGEELIDLIFGAISVFKKGGIGKNSRTPTGMKMSDIPYLSLKVYNLRRERCRRCWS